jgi:lipopolysaccharide export LptBFGC system permease protein LptF
MGFKGVGFLFGLIFVFLLVVCLQQTGHAKLAAECGLAGCALLAVGTGTFLLRRWRTASDEQAFHDDGDVPFALAVFLLVLLAPLILALGSAPPLTIVLLFAAAIPARKFVKSLRHSS